MFSFTWPDLSLRRYSAESDSSEPSSVRPLLLPSNLSQLSLSRASPPLPSLDSTDKSSEPKVLSFDMRRQHPSQVLITKLFFIYYFLIIIIFIIIIIIIINILLIERITKHCFCSENPTFGSRCPQYWYCQCPAEARLWKWARWATRAFLFFFCFWLESRFQQPVFSLSFHFTPPISLDFFQSNETRNNYYL